MTAARRRRPSSRRPEPACCATPRTRRPGFSRTRGARRTAIAAQARQEAERRRCRWHGRRAVRRRCRRPPRCGGGPGVTPGRPCSAAQREAYDELRARVRAAVDGLRGEPGYDRLLEALARMAQLEAGPARRLARLPTGGVVARSARRGRGLLAAPTRRPGRRGAGRGGAGAVGAMTTAARVARVNGPLVEVEGLAGAAMSDVVELGERRLPGEVVAIRGDVTTVQAYEYTGGLAPGDPARSLGEPLSARLGPHLLGGVFDGLLRPLTGAPAWLEPGAVARAPRPAGSSGSPRRWRWARLSATAPASASVAVAGGIGYRVLAPPGLSGTVEEARPAGLAAGDSVIAVVSGVAVRLTSDWPVRRPRPYRRRLDGAAPLLTGQRVVDVLFPVTRGGATAVPGGFGTGKTVLLQQIAKWCDADVIVYVGCGERGNELADLLARAGRADRSADRRAPGRADRGHRQHLQHADDGARGQHLQRGHGRRVLPRHGAGRRRGRRLDLAVGGGAARVRLAQRRAARRGGLPGQPLLGSGRVLRARRPRDHQRGPRGLGHHHRRGLPGGRRPDRAGHHVHAAVRPRACGRWTATSPTPGTTRRSPGLDRSPATSTPSPPGMPRSGDPAWAERRRRLAACSRSPTGSAR